MTHEQMGTDAINGKIRKIKYIDRITTKKDRKEKVFD